MGMHLLLLALFIAILTPINGQDDIADRIQQAVIGADEDTRRNISSSPGGGGVSASGVGTPGAGGRGGVGPGAAGPAGGGVAPPRQRVPSGDSPKDKLDLFSGQIEDPRAATQATRSGLFAQNLKSRLRGVAGAASPGTIRAQLAQSPLVRQNCQEVIRDPCVPNYPYRVPDGTCNHVDPDIKRGASLTVQPRLVPNAYDDGEGSPRTKSKLPGQKLKSARLISNTVLSTTPPNTSPKSNLYTVTLVHFAQFVDHDIIATPNAGRLIEGEGGTIYETKIDNCDENCQNPEETHVDCFPIPLPAGDNNFQNEFGSSCLHFVRRKPATDAELCDSPIREQRNDRTSFLDLSSTYGSSQIRYDELREKIGGRLNASEGDLLPFGPEVEDCLSEVQQCFNSGDDRHQEIPMLTVIHINFLREHNRIAAELAEKNPQWADDDEKLFQEAKKILTGIYQHIVYNEYLPAILGYFHSYWFNLMSAPSGHRNVYNQDVDPSTRNEFGVAAYRFGHSLVGRFVNAMDESSQPVLPNSGDLLRHDFFNNEKIRDDDMGPTGIGRWMANTKMRKLDKFISEQLRNHLFENVAHSDSIGKSDGFDLAAFNIQRGRDHGIPGYNEFRKWCGLHPAYFFNNGYWGFRDHDYATVKQLESVYDHPDDVDLFVGGISERPQSPFPYFSGLLGPTFSCMIANQFKQYKEGDRFFYENPFPDTGFTTDQINDIKRQKFAGIYCRSLGLEKIQRNVFEKPGPFNPIVSCDSLPKPTLDLWKV